jgi:hypothetical protein
MVDRNGERNRNRCHRCGAKGVELWNGKGGLLRGLPGLRLVLWGFFKGGDRGLVQVVYHVVVDLHCGRLRRRGVGAERSGGRVIVIKSLFVHVARRRVSTGREISGLVEEGAK